jgi:hypothetical protein
VATVFRELVRAGGDVHLDWCLVNEQLATTYGGAAEMLQGCVLLGVQSAESQQLTLNPPDYLMLQPGDRLVALTRQQGEVLTIVLLHVYNVLCPCAAWPLQLHADQLPASAIISTCDNQRHPTCL